jgi:predicted small secreted protein
MGRRDRGLPATRTAIGAALGQPVSQPRIVVRRVDIERTVPMTKTRRLLLLLAAILLTGSMTACGDTWRGAKEDTSDNLKATGTAVQKAGQKVEP